MTMSVKEFRKYGSFTQLLILSEKESIDINDIFAFFTEGIITGELLHAARKMRAWTQEGKLTRLQCLLKSRRLPKRRNIRH